MTVALRRHGVLIAIFACASVPIAAQTPVPLALTLEAAVARALEQAPRIAEARARESAADAIVEARQSAARPTITASGGYLRTNHVEEFGVPQPSGAVRVLFPDIPSNYRARLEVGVPLYTSGRVASAVDAASADRRSAAADRRTAEEDVELDVTRAYWMLVTARQTVAVMTQALERTDAYVADVQSRVDAGVLPPNDVLSAQAQRARQNVRLIQARNDAALAEMDLARQIGADLGQRIEPTSAIDAPLPGAAEVVAQPAEALVARALERRPEREALAARRESLRFSADAALAALRPQVAALAAVEPARPNPRFVPRAEEWRTSWDLGVQLAWPLFDGGRARAERAASLAQADAVTERLRDFDALVAIDVRQRLLDLESSRAALGAAGEGVTAAAEARRVVEERFRAGVATSTDVLEAQVALLEAELERTRLSAALRFGEARLLRAIGGGR